MESLRSIIERQQRASPQYFDDPLKDRMLATILSLAEEVCVLRDRLDTCRRLAEQGKPATDANINAYEVEDELLRERLALHEQYFKATLAEFVPD